MCMREKYTETPNLTFKSIFTRLLEQGEKYLIWKCDMKMVRDAGFEKLKTSDNERTPTTNK